MKTGMHLLALGPLAACNPAVEEKCDAEPTAEQRLHAYDDAGRLVETRVSRDGASQPDHVWTYAYDAAGRLVSRRLDAAGAVVRTETRTYDAQGRQTAETTDGDVGHWEQTFAYDATGRPTEAIKRAVYEVVTVDEDKYAKPKDFEPLEDPITASTPDGVRVDLWLGSQPLDERRFEQRLVALYVEPGAGEPAAPEGLGLFGRRLRSGDTLQDDVDWDVDGDFDSRVVVRFDAAGERVEERGFALEGGEARLVNETLFDGHERIERRFDEGGELTYEARTTYDDNGERLTRDEDRDGDGEVDWRKTYTLDAAGHRVAESRDADADGDVDRQWSYTWDGELLTREDGLVSSGNRDLCSP